MEIDVSQLAGLSNPLATPEQIVTTSSQLDGVSAELEASIQFASARLIQAAGILLELPQDLIAQAIVIFYRFYVGAEGGSFRFNSATEISAATLYLAAKPSSHPRSPRSILNVFTYLTSSVSPTSQTQHKNKQASNNQPDPELFCLSEGEYQRARETLYHNESIVLRATSFSIRVVTPHHVAMTYLQTLGVLPSPPTEMSRRLAAKTLEHLNSALLSPQLLYLTHQPTSLAVAAIYMAAREVGVKLSGEAWWEVFDVDRETLGFLAVALNSMVGWVEDDQEKWLKRGRACPLTGEQVEQEIALQNEGDTG